MILSLFMGDIIPWCLEVRWDLPDICAATDWPAASSPLTMFEGKEASHKEVAGRGAGGVEEDTPAREVQEHAHSARGVLQY